MKKLYLNLLALLTVAVLLNLSTQAQSAFCTKVLDYVPAPGQYTNKNYPKYEVGDTQDSLNKKAFANLQKPNGLVSLGAYGGYIVFGFDHPIANSRGNYDFKVFGNAFTGNPEPGIVMVSQDVNGNGLPDDPWYEIKGSVYDFCTKNYEITYTKPTEGLKKVPWTDNLGRKDSMPGAFPAWITEETLTFKGTLFEDSLRNKANLWGYADNVPNTDELSKIKISWAIDSEGNPVHLPSIDFVKVYSAMNKYAGILGEMSTELQYPGVEDLHPKMNTYAEENTLDPEKEYHILNLSGLLSSPDSIWDETLQYEEDLDELGYGFNNKTFGKNPFVFHYATAWDGASWEGFTYTNKTNTTDKFLTTNQFSAITGGGIDGKDSTYVTAYFSEMTLQMLDYGILNNHHFSFSENKNYRIAGTYITNTTATYYSMLEGDAFAKKFGGENGTDKDWFKVTFEGIDTAGKSTGTVDFYLADFRSDNSEEDYIINNWRWVDLSSLGNVAKVYYTVSSSDTSSYGGYMNTPAYFCLDKVAVEKQRSNNLLSEVKVNEESLANFSSEKNHYTIQLPFGTETVPTIFAQRMDEYATIFIQNAQTLSDTTFITVTAENGNTNIYSFYFLVTEGNSNADLAWIKVSDSLLNNFSANKLTYEILLPSGIPMPVITTQTADETAVYKISEALTLSDTTFITVTAQNGTTKTYAISYKEKITTGIQQIDEMYSFSVYPNPVTNGKLFIMNYEQLKINNGTANSLRGTKQSITFFDLNGRLVETFDINGENTELNISHLPKGNYILRISNKQSILFQEKILKW